MKAMSVRSAMGTGGARHRDGLPVARRFAGRENHVRCTRPNAVRPGSRSSTRRSSSGICVPQGPRAPLRNVNRSRAWIMRTPSTVKGLPRCVRSSDRKHRPPRSAGILSVEKCTHPTDFRMFFPSCPALILDFLHAVLAVTLGFGSSFRDYPAEQTHTPGKDSVVPWGGPSRRAFRSPMRRATSHCGRSSSTERQASTALPNPYRRVGKRSAKPWRRPAGCYVRCAQTADLHALRAVTTSVRSGQHGFAKRLRVAGINRTWCTPRAWGVRTKRRRA